MNNRRKMNGTLVTSTKAAASHEPSAMPLGAIDQDARRIAWVPDKRIRIEYARSRKKSGSRAWPRKLALGPLQRREIPRLAAAKAPCRLSGNGRGVKAGDHQMQRKYKGGQHHAER